MLRVFRSIFQFEFKKFTGRRNIIIFLFLFLLCSYLISEGIVEYKAAVQNKKKFQELERLKITQFINYTQYGAIGFRVLFIPSPLAALFYNSCSFTELTANIDTSERMKIYNPYKGKTLFSEKLGSFTDPAGILILVGCLLAMAYGFNTFLDEDYVKFLCDYIDHKGIFRAVLLARLILLNAFFLLLSGFSVFCTYIGGIKIVNVFFIGYVFVLQLLVTFFFLSGAAVGTLKNKSTRFLVFTAVYFVFVFLFPWTTNKIISKKANNLTSIYQLEKEKLGTILKFEKYAIEHQGRYEEWKGKTESGRDMIEGFWNGDFRRMQEAEAVMRKEIKEYISKYQWYSVIFPTTFYLSVGNEVSSRGYNGFMAYYDYVQDVSERFMRFYIDKKFYSNHSEIEPFIKGDENIFCSTSSLPGNFWPGILVTFGYINLLIASLYVRHRKKFVVRKVRKPDIEFPKDRNILFVLCRDAALKDDVFHYYHTREDASCLKKIDTNDFQFSVGLEETLNHFNKISGIDKQKAARNLELMGIQDPGAESPGHEVILKLYAAVKTAADSEYIVVDDFVKGESRRFELDFFRLVDSLDAAGKKLVFLSTEMYYPAESLNEKISVENFSVFTVHLDNITLR
jgi:hypothetical protein